MLLRLQQCCRLMSINHILFRPCLSTPSWCCVIAPGWCSRHLCPLRLNWSLTGSCLLIIWKITSRPQLLYPFLTRRWRNENSVETSPGIRQLCLNWLVVTASLIIISQLPCCKYIFSNYLKFSALIYCEVICLKRLMCVH